MLVHFYFAQNLAKSGTKLVAFALSHLVFRMEYELERKKYMEDLEFYMHIFSGFFGIFRIFSDALERRQRMGFRIINIARARTFIYLLGLKLGLALRPIHRKIV